LPYAQPTSKTGDGKMTSKEKIAWELEQLNEIQVQQVADFIAFLRFQNRF
jgi:hypothetical protein